MASRRELVLSFAGGEVAPHLLNRVDDGSVRQSVAKCENFITWAQGAAQRRPGFATVRRVKDSTKRTRLIPFSYGLGQELAVEVGEGYFRFHAQGATLLYVSTLEVASVSTADDTITFTSDHGLATDDQIRFQAGPGGTLPGPIGNYAIVVDARTIKTSFTAGGAAINITSAGTLPVYVHPISEEPTGYKPSRAFSAGTPPNTTTNVITTDGAHNLTTGDPITFTLTGGVLPTYTDGLATRSILEGVVYYADVTGPSAFRVATTAANAIAGTHLDLNGAGSGTPTVHYYYTPGMKVTSSGLYYLCLLADPQLNVPGSAPTYWFEMPPDGVLEIPNDYDKEDLFDLHYAQSGDVMTIVHTGYQPMELRRLGPQDWSFVPVTFAPPLQPPTNVEASSIVYSLSHAITAVTNSGAGALATITTEQPHGLQPNEIVYIRGGVVGTIPVNAFYAVVDAPMTTTVRLKSVETGLLVDCLSSTVSGAPKLMPASLTTETSNTYKVTSVGADGSESNGSSSVTIANNLLRGGSNTIRWTAASGAVGYHVYKWLNGVFGYIGQSSGSSLTFTDDNIGPDMGRTIPIEDTSLQGDYPGAVGYFEGRRIFAGTASNLRGTWWSRIGFYGDFRYHIPIQDDDRIQRDIEAAKSVAIRHVVPMAQLLLLTDSAEFRVSPINTDAITPESFSARPTTTIGASTVQPIIIGGACIFVANRGGHVREFGFRGDGQGGSIANGDLSTRAIHLFDGLDVVDLSVQKAPRTIVWAVSTDGRLLGFTYYPEEGVGGWHQHQTDGLVKSVCVVNDGSQEDSVYVVVERELDGDTYQFVERMAEQVQPAAASDWRFLDACHTFDGTNTTSTTLSIARSATWAAGQTVTITASAQTFRLTGDTGSYVRAAYQGSYYRLNITAVSSGTSATATIVDAIPIATATTSFAAGTDWGFMRRTITTPTYLDGVTLTYVVDGVPAARTITPASGTVTLSAPALKVHLGLPYTSRLRLLPVSLQVEALARGRTANPGEVWARYWRSSTFKIGPTDDASTMATIAADPTQDDGITRKHLFGGWTESSQLRIVQDQPLPLTLTSLTIDVSIGS